MKTVRRRVGWLGGLALAALVSVPNLDAQTTTMPSTQKYGSGLLDIPVASVLPHLTITGTYSGFFMDLDRTIEIDDTGNAIGFGNGVDKFFSDASVTLGLFDRVEVGGTVQSLNDAAEGGNIWGLFGRLQLIKPSNQGLGVAVGTRYVTAQDFGGANEVQPNRLGIPDSRLRERYTGPADDVSSEVTFYGVASAYLRGFEQGALPDHDITISLGYGTGMFQDGDQLGFYNFADSEGWFFGSALHVQAGPSVLTLMGEYNGFDINLGTQLDLGGIRIGAQYLATNYGEPAGGFFSEYRKPKFGLLASVALNPNEGGLHKPRLMARPAPDTIMLPAPPPDTVRITREVAPELPEGSPASICLATGADVQVRVSPQGDTLVGPSRVPIRTLRPGVVFAGTYAAGAAWFQNDDAITFEERQYDKSGEEVRLDCAQIMRVGEHMGVPLFVMRNAERPFEMIYVPVRPGIWQGYQAGLRRTRGQ